MTPSWDVLVIGGGPAGSASANLLAQAGLSVLLLEKGTFPRFHIGESLLPQSMPILRRLGVEMEGSFIRKYGARFCDSATRKIAAFRFREAFGEGPAWAYQVPRARFDQDLLQAARRAGVEVREGWEVSSIRVEADRAVGAVARTPSGAEEAISARMVVDASGRDTLVARRRECKMRLPKLDRSAIYGHFEGVWREDGDAEGNIQIVLFEHGWFWFIPFLGARTSVGCVVSPEWVRARRGNETFEDFFSRTVSLSPFATEWLAGARRVSEIEFTADFSYRVREIAGPGWVLVGDAAGFIDPLFSTGVHLALKSAELAADAIAPMLRDGDIGAHRFDDFVRLSRRGAELFVGVVQAFYDGAFRELLFADDQRDLMRKIITSLLSGDVFDESATWSRFLAERYPAALPE